MHEEVVDHTQQHGEDRSEMGSDHPNILTGKTVALCLAVRQVVQFVAAPVVVVQHKRHS